MAVQGNRPCFKRNATKFYFFMWVSFNGLFGKLTTKNISTGNTEIEILTFIWKIFQLEQLKMRTSIIIYLFLFFGTDLYATVFPLSDTTGNKLKPRDAAILEKYGTDYVSKAVILKFFSRKRSLMITGIGTLAGAGLMAIGLSASGSTSASIWQEVAEYALLRFGLFFFGIIFLLSTGFYLFHSRKRLIRILDKYRSTGRLPKSYKGVIKTDK